MCAQKLEVLRQNVLRIFHKKFWEKTPNRRQYIYMYVLPFIFSLHGTKKNALYWNQMALVYFLKTTFESLSSYCCKSHNVASKTNTRAKHLVESTTSMSVKLYFSKYLNVKQVIETICWKRLCASLPSSTLEFTGAQHLLLSQIILKMKKVTW